MDLNFENGFKLVVALVWEWPRKLFIFEFFNQIVRNFAHLNMLLIFVIMKVGNYAFSRVVDDFQFLFKIKINQTRIPAVVLSGYVIIFIARSSLKEEITRLLVEQ